jgi:hypothetical protein
MYFLNGENMNRITMLCMFLMLSSCYHNGRDAQEAHQIIAEPSTHWVHWEQEPPVDVTKERETKPIKPCQQFS